MTTTLKEVIINKNTLRMTMWQQGILKEFEVEVITAENIVEVRYQTPIRAEATKEYKKQAKRLTDKQNASPFIKDDLKAVYKDLLLNKHHKPINYLDTDLKLREEMKRLEAKSGLLGAELDAIFNEAKQEVLKEIGK